MIKIVLLYWLPCRPVYFHTC